MRKALNETELKPYTQTMSNIAPATQTDTCTVQHARSSDKRSHERVPPAGYSCKRREIKTDTRHMLIFDRCQLLLEAPPYFNSEDNDDDEINM